MAEKVVGIAAPENVTGVASVKDLVDVTFAKDYVNSIRELILREVDASKIPADLLDRLCDHAEEEILHSLKSAGDANLHHVVTSSAPCEVPDDLMDKIKTALNVYNPEERNNHWLWDKYRLLPISDPQYVILARSEESQSGLTNTSTDTTSDSVDL